MMHPQQVMLIREKVDPVLHSKVEEFQLLGYDAVTADEVWECVISKYKKEWPMCHQIVNNIYSLKPALFMNWLTMNYYQGKIDIRKNELL